MLLKLLEMMKLVNHSFANILNTKKKSYKIDNENNRLQLAI